MFIMYVMLNFQINSTNGRSKLRAEKLFAVSFCIAMGICQCVYWIRAVEVAKHAFIGEDEKLYWTSGPEGSFFPWPREPGWLMVITPSTSRVDHLIFLSIKFYLYIPIAIGVTISFTYLGWCLGKFFYHELPNRKSS